MLVGILVAAIAVVGPAIETDRVIIVADAQINRRGVPRQELRENEKQRYDQFRHFACARQSETLP
jgi:hypothetical protein